MWGVTGIVYQTKLDPPPAAWRDLFTTRLAGKITMLDDPPEVLGSCLKMLGYSLNSSDPAELKRAQTEAIEQKRLVRSLLKRRRSAGAACSGRCRRRASLGGHRCASHPSRAPKARLHVSLRRLRPLRGHHGDPERKPPPGRGAHFSKLSPAPSRSSANRNGRPNSNRQRSRAIPAPARTQRQPRPLSIPTDAVERRMV